MQIPSANADGILTDLRYASVHGRAAAVTDKSSEGAGVGAPIGTAALVALAALLAGCAPGAEPRTFAVPAAAAARIRMVCPPGTFIGTMTANCPQILPAAR